MNKIDRWVAPIGHAIADLLGISDCALILYLIGGGALLLLMVILMLVAIPFCMLGVWVSEMMLHRQSSPNKVVKMERRFAAAIKKQNKEEMDECVKKVEAIIAYAKREQDLLKFHLWKQCLANMKVVVQNYEKQEKRNLIMATE